MNRTRVSHAHGFGKFHFARQGQGERQECRISLPVLQRRTERCKKISGNLCCPFCPDITNHLQKKISRQSLSSLPAIKSVAVVGKEESQILSVIGIMNLNGSREITQQRRHGRNREVDKGEGLFSLGKLKGS